MENNVYIDEENRKIIEDLRDKISKILNILQYDFKTDHVTLPLGMCSCTIMDIDIGGDTDVENGEDQHE